MVRENAWLSPIPADWTLTKVFEESGSRTMRRVDECCHGETVGFWRSPVWVNMAALVGTALTCLSSLPSPPRPQRRMILLHRQVRIDHQIQRFLRGAVDVDAATAHLLERGADRFVA